MSRIIHAVWNAWVGHIVLAGACVWSLHVHAMYRVPAGRLVAVLPWLGVVVTVLTLLVVVLALLSPADTSVMARLVDRVERRAVRLATVVIPMSVAASCITRGTWWAAVLFGLGIAMAAVSLAAIGRRLVSDVGVSIIDGLRRLERVVFFVVAAFLVWTGIVFINGAFDVSVPAQYESDILAVMPAVIDVGGGDLVPHTEVHLRSWRSPGRVAGLVLAPAEMHRMWVGEPVIVHVHAGLLRIPWVSALTLDKVRRARRILEETPGAFHALKLLIGALLERRQWEEAVSLTRRYTRLYPDDVEEVEFVAGKLGFAGHRAEQVALLEPLVVRQPDYRTLCMLGLALDRRGDHRRAVEVLTQATRLRPDLFDAFHFLGEAYTALGQREDAIRAYEAELVGRPRSLAVRRRIQALRDGLDDR